MRRVLAVCLLLLGLFAVGSGLGRKTGFNLFPPAAKAPPREFPVLEPSQPRRIRIPSIRLDATLREVGLDRDGAIDVLPVKQRNDAGWFNQGPSPGEYGPAIIVGHVDTGEQPSVFHRLKELVPGARIEIARRDHNVAVFEVNSVRQYNKRALPSAVYHDFSRPALRLITCAGEWVGGRAGYTDNLVVYASLMAHHSA